MEEDETVVCVYYDAANEQRRTSVWGIRFRIDDDREALRRSLRAVADDLRAAHQSAGLGPTLADGSPLRVDPASFRDHPLLRTPEAYKARLLANAAALCPALAVPVASPIASHASLPAAPSCAEVAVVAVAEPVVSQADASEWQQPVVVAVPVATCVEE